MSIHIVLVEPEIPPNTGNIARSCAATDSVLHLVKPLGFSLDEKSLRRAGLDYWDKLEIHYYDSNEDFFEKTKGGVYYYFSKKANHRYTDISYPDKCYIVFGKETKGLPEKLLYDNPESTVRIPMLDGARCLNLSSAAAVAAYEVLRQWDFPELSNDGRLKEYNWKVRNEL